MLWAVLADRDQITKLSILCYKSNGKLFLCGTGFPFQAPAPLTPANNSNMFSLLGDLDASSVFNGQN